MTKSWALGFAVCHKQELFVAQELINKVKIKVLRYLGIIGMNWIILLLAGLFEVSLTFCLGKTRAASGVEFYLWGSGFLASTILSMALLAKAVQTLPLGTAYAIWTGIGAVGTVLIGIFVFKEPATPIRLFFLFTLIASLIGLKVVSY